MNVVNCDECNKEFVIEMKEKDVGQGITKIYFSCPHCKEEYLVHYSNVLILKKQKQIRDKQQEYNDEVKLKDRKKAQSRYNQIKKLQKALKKDMENLEKRMQQ